MKTFIRPPLTYRIIFILSFLITAPPYSQFEYIIITNHPDDQSETHICVSPLNSNLLLATWNDWRSSSYTRPGYAFSTDGDLTWPTQGIVTPPEFTYGVVPSGGFDRFGNVFYCYMTPVPECGASNHGPIFVSKTTNLGNSWSHTQVSYICSDKPLMTIDNTGGFYDGRIYVTYTQFHSGGSRVKFAYSTNNGMSFSQEVTLGADEQHHPSC